MTTNYLSLIEWPRPWWHLVEYFGLFFSIGAVGFRYSSLRGKLGSSPLYDRIAKRAAWLGALGAALTMVHIVQVLPRLAQRAKVPVSQLLTTLSPSSAWFWLTVLAIAAFLIAGSGRRVAWHFAAVGVIAGVLRNLGQGPIGRMTTPVHVLTGGLWIGTLFVLVLAGLSVVLHPHRDDEQRGAVVADLVNGFSPLALTCGLLVVTFGVIAALRELEPFSALWTTPYGYTLIAKVCVVGVVLALGAWNWRRQRPTLGSDDAAYSIHRSATSELIAATLVLIITSIMLSLPEPH